MKLYPLPQCCLVDWSRRITNWLLLHRKSSVLCKDSKDKRHQLQVNPNRFIFSQPLINQGLELPSNWSIDTMDPVIMGVGVKVLVLMEYHLANIVQVVELTQKRPIKPVWAARLYHKVPLLPAKHLPDFEIAYQLVAFSRWTETQFTWRWLAFCVK